MENILRWNVKKDSQLMSARILNPTNVNFFQYILQFLNLQNKNNKKLHV